jgi:DNA damage-binding protein 1
VADHFLNLYSYQKQTRAATEDDSRLLKCDGTYHLGDMVNRFSRGSIVMRTQDSIIGETEGVIFGTLFGMIGMIFSLPEPLYDFLSRVEEAVCQVLKPFGGFSHKEFRAREIPHRRSEALGFIDGDVVEKLLFMSFEDQVKVAEKVEKGLDPAAMIAKVEMMARLH